MTVVVGAGVIGLAVADALARRGAEVVVLDRRAPGRGASQASAGILAPYTEADAASPLLALGTRSLQLFDDFIAGAAARSGRRIEYARSGTLEVALDAHDAQQLQAARAWLDAAGVASDWLDAPALRAAAPAVTPAALGALKIHAHGFVGVTSLVAALAQSARRAGAIIVTPAEAIRITPTRDQVEVRAGEERYHAESVVIAAGSWSRRVRVDGVAELPVRPVRGQLLHLNWTAGAPPASVVWGPRCYTVPWSDGSLLVGATMEEVGFDESTTADGIRALTEAVVELLPGARAAAFIEARAGLRPATPDGLPAIGPLRAAPRVVMATGHFRNGILLAPLTAEVVADYVIDGKSDPVFEITSPGRFLS
jgi:glycine oxidase